MDGIEEVLQQRQQQQHDAERSSTPGPAGDPERDGFAEIKAHIVNLVSALGGPDLAEEDHAYRLGDDALGCLRDLKRWLKVYDEKNDSLDVARAISETSLVTFDLLEILTRWDMEEEELDDEEEEEENEEDEAAKRRKMRREKKARIALACLELLVPLTWPIVLSKSSNPNHFHHAPHLEFSYLRYKHAILAHPQNRIFRAVIRLCLPALSIPEQKRTIRQKSTLKLTVYLFRNIFRINYRDNMDSLIESTYIDTSRNTEIQVLAKQNVLDFLMTLSSNISASEFSYLNTPLMEALYYLLYGIDVEALFVGDSQDPASAGPASRNEGRVSDLKSLLSREKTLQTQMKAQFAKRTNRSSALVTLKDARGETSAVFSRMHLIGGADAYEALDQYKTKSTPRYSNASLSMKSNIPGADSLDRLIEGQWDVSILLTKETRELLTEFCTSFLKIAFNPLFRNLRSFFESEWNASFEFSSALQYEHQVHFLYLASLFLSMERARLAAEVHETGAKDMDFGLIAEVLTQNMFVIVMRMMKASLEARAWAIAYTSMRCFNEIIMTTNDMERIGDQIMRDMADNMKHRLFYLEEWLTTLSLLPCVAHTQNISFINMAVEVTYNTLSTLEKFTHKNKNIYIQASRRRAAKRKTKKVGDDGENVEEDEEEAEIREYALRERQYNDRKLDFVSFQRKFLKEDVIETLIIYLNNHKELSTRQLKWGLNLVHRFFVVAKYHVGFFRLDFMRMLDRILDSRTLGKDMKTEFERFNKFFMRTFIAMLDKTPSLECEILFHKVAGRVFYLENGIMAEDTKKPKANRRIAGKVALPMVFDELDDYTGPREHRFRILVAALIDTEKRELLEWTIKALTGAYDARMAWIGSTEVNDAVQITEEVLNPKLSPQMNDKEAQEIEIGLRKNGTFRLLLSECGLKLDDGVDRTACVLPADALMETVQKCLEYMKRFNNEGTEFPDGKLAGAFLREDKPTRRRRGGPTALKRADESGDDDDNGADLDGFIERDGGDDDSDSSGDDDDDDEEEAAATGDEGTGEKRKRGSGGGARRKKKSRADKSKNRAPRAADQDKHRPKRQVIVRPKVAYKSAEFITESDDEDDEERDREFFEREAKQREIEKAKMDLLLRRAEQLAAQPEAPAAARGIEYPTDTDDEGEREDKEPEDVDMEEEETGADDDGSDDDDGQSPAPAMSTPISSTLNGDDHSDAEEEEDDYDMPIRRRHKNRANSSEESIDDESRSALSI